MMRFRRLTTRQLLWGLSGVGMFGMLFWPTFLWMAERFDAQDSFYSHGWLVPLAAAWLIWQRRAHLATIPRRAGYGGLALLVPSLIVHVVATWWHIGFVSGFAMLGTIGGVVWTAWGFPMVWALRFPLLFLLFMVPLPGIMLISISFYMKLLAATLATMCLHGLGMAAQQAGSIIHLPGISVIIDDTCSGLRSLISLIALSTLWTSLMPASSRRWQKLAIVCSSIPIALVANMARILILVLVAVIYGRAAATGFLHYGSGIVVFGVALAALVWLSRRLTHSAVVPSRP